MSVTITGEGVFTLSDKNTLGVNKCTGNTVADITDSGTSTKHSAYIRTGTYTGDGAVSKAITGVGFQPKYVRIWTRQTVNNADVVIVETTDTIGDDHANGGAIVLLGGTVDFVTDRIISLDADGFTVGDAGADLHPNKNGQVYNYLCFG